MSCTAIIVAAGRGRRLGQHPPKPFVALGGRPLVVWALRAFQRCEEIDAVVLVVAEEQRGKISKMLEEHRLSKVRAVCSGGDDRPSSVRAGLAMIGETAELVAIHDGARPLVTPEVISRVVKAARDHGAAIPIIASQDTVKRGAEGKVLRTEDRDSLFLAQTPQVFDAQLIRQAYSTAPGSGAFNDDAEVVERFGATVRLVEGDPHNFKVTVPADLLLAEALLRPVVAPRIGVGYDVHQLSAGRKLVLGGVEIDHPVGLLGHSDADVLCHAVGDALLGACALGDIGHHFPPSDERLKDAGSLEILRHIEHLTAKVGFEVGNVDATIVCELPPLAPASRRMAENLAEALRTRGDRISVKATTSEGLGPPGRGEGIAAFATVLLLPTRGGRG